MIGLMLMSAFAQDDQVPEYSTQPIDGPGLHVPVDVPALQVIGENWCAQRALWWDEDGAAHDLILGDVPLPSFEKDPEGVPHFGIYRRYTASDDDGGCKAGGVLLYRELSGGGFPSFREFLAAAREMHEAVNTEADCPSGRALPDVGTALSLDPSYGDFLHDTPETVLSMEVQEVVVVTSDRTGAATSGLGSKLCKVTTCTRECTFGLSMLETAFKDKIELTDSIWQAVFDKLDEVFPLYDGGSGTGAEADVLPDMGSAQGGWYDDWDEFGGFTTWDEMMDCGCGSWGIHGTFNFGGTSGGDGTATFSPDPGCAWDDGTDDVEPELDPETEDEHEETRELEESGMPDSNIITSGDGGGSAERDGEGEVGDPCQWDADQDGCDEEEYPEDEGERDTGTCTDTGTSE